MANDSDTITAVWKSCGESFDSQAFLDKHAISCADVWSIGDRLPMGRVRHDSGFTIVIGESSVLDQLMATVEQFIRDSNRRIEELQRLKAYNSVSFRFGIGDTLGYARSLSFSSDTLVLLGSNRISIDVLACLQSD
jgi:hypothetical protein